MASAAVVVIADEEFEIRCDGSFVFGRADADGVVGLDANDMGISAEAGSVECDGDLWWVVNRSRKRPLLLDSGAGGALLRLDPGVRHAVAQGRLSVLVPGVIYTHRIEVLVAVDDLAWLRAARPTSGTITGEVRLSEHDRSVMIALLGGYLEEFPRRQLHPRTYQEAADILGSPWTKTTVRKQVERLKNRLAVIGVYLEGPRANYDLADYLIGNGMISPADLNRVGRGS